MPASPIACSAPRSVNEPILGGQSTGGRRKRRGRCAPELPFGEAADEGAELVVAGGGEGRGGLAALLDLVCEEVVLEGGVEAGLEEGEEEVEEVNCVGV